MLGGFGADLILECLKSLSIMALFQEAFALTLHIEVGSMLGGFLVDLGWIWGAFGVDFRCWEGLGGVLGVSWAALGSPWAPKIDF